MTGLVGILAVAVVAWFAAGTIWNVRLGRETLRWLQGGLPLLGERTTLRWLGSTAVELVINEGKAEFARATVVIFLEPRDLVWWPLSRLRGRRDTLIVRGVLRRAPAFELDALAPGEAAAARRAEALLALARSAGMQVTRLRLRRAEPHFELHVALPDRGLPARAFFEAVGALARLALN